VHQTLAACRRACPSAPASITYAYNGTVYDMAVRRTSLLRAANIDGREYRNLARTDFEVRNRTTRETSKFQLTYATDGDLAGVPVHAVYQPKWWFEVQLFLDDRAAF
jgi:hypothetical protein